jgi:hypothetical protein
MAAGQAGLPAVVRGFLAVLVRFIGFMKPQRIARNARSVVCGDARLTGLCFWPFSAPRRVGNVVETRFP